MYLGVAFTGLKGKDIYIAAANCITSSEKSKDKDCVSVMKFTPPGETWFDDLVGALGYLEYLGADRSAVDYDSPAFKGHSLPLSILKTIAKDSLHEMVCLPACLPVPCSCSLITYFVGWFVRLFVCLFVCLWWKEEEELLVEGS